MADVRFTRIWEDRSDDRGFRFEFRCERCHSAYSSSTIPGDSRMPGAWDRALGLAVEQMERDVFLPCATCRQWVCGPRCWNHAAKSCTSCRPAAAQASHAGYQGVPPQPHQSVRPQPQSQPAATEAWAPDMQAELRAMLREEQQQRAPQSQAGQGATEAWAPDMQSELRAMLNESQPARRPAPAQAPAPAQLPKFCNQCGSPLTGRFCGRCGRPAY